MKQRAPSTRQMSRAISELVPNILRGVRFDFFASRAVTQTQFMLLVAIHSYGRPTMTLLARNLKVKMPTATGIVDRLVRAGYVRRSPDPGDRRKVSVELTAEGRRFIGDFQEVIRRRWNEVLKSLSPGELSAFYGVVAKLRRSLEAGG